MMRILTFIVVILVAAIFWAVVPILRLFDAFQPMVVVFSVIIAAVFVRLNRGMPSLEWKSLEREKRKILTAKIVNLSKEYVAIVSINGISLIVLITIIVIGKDAICNISPSFQKIISAGVGALFSLCVMRMSYIVWRDCDIMELQKYLIDNVSDGEHRELEIKSAYRKLEEMKSSGLKNQSRPDVSEL